MTKEVLASKKERLWLLWFFLAIGFLLWIGWWAIATVMYSNPEERGQLGDLFGGINALFTAFAFGGLIFTVLLQRKELHLQRLELALTREELKNQSDELRRQANATENAFRTSSRSLVLTILDESKDVLISSAKQFLSAYAEGIKTIEDLSIHSYMALFLSEEINFETRRALLLNFYEITKYLDYQDGGNENFYLQPTKFGFDNHFTLKDSIDCIALRETEDGKFLIQLGSELHAEDGYRKLLQDVSEAAGAQDIFYTSYSAIQDLFSVINTAIENDSEMMGFLAHHPIGRILNDIYSIGHYRSDVIDQMIRSTDGDDESDNDNSSPIIVRGY